MALKIYNCIRKSTEIKKEFTGASVQISTNISQLYIDILIPNLIRVYQPHVSQLNVSIMMVGFDKSTYNISDEV